MTTPQGMLDEQRAVEILSAELRGSTAEFLGWLTGLVPPSEKENIPPEMRPALDKMVGRLTEAAKQYALRQAAAPQGREALKAGTIPQTDEKRQFPLHELAPDFTLIDRDSQADERLKLYRDIFAEITAKAIPVCDPASDDPERVRHYQIPVGPLHRAAGKLGFQLFNGEQYLADAVKEIARLNALTPAVAPDGVGEEIDNLIKRLEYDDMAVYMLDPLRLEAARMLRRLAALAQAQEPIGEQQILDEANRRYPQEDGAHRRAFIEGAGWGLNNRAPPPQVDSGREDDPLTDLVARFSATLLEKLRTAEQKYGYKNGWARDGWKAECQRHLNEHLAKGDPRDVAAYCAFLWHHGWPTILPDPREYERGAQAIAVLSEMLKAYDAGALQMSSPEIGEPENDIQYHPWHEEFLHHARAALGPEEDKR